MILAHRRPATADKKAANKSVASERAVTAVGPLFVVIEGVVVVVVVDVICQVLFEAVELVTGAAEGTAVLTAAAVTVLGDEFASVAVNKTTNTIAHRPISTGDRMVISVVR
jgi:membrane-associated protease RseP (regulator of RpoE activity)